MKAATASPLSPWPVPSRSVTRRWPWVLALLMILGALSTTVGASPIRLDDTGTYLSPPHLRLQWRDVLGRGTSRQMEASARLSVRLDTRAHAGRSARIYLVMPVDLAGALVLQWQGRGVLLAGRLAPGERALVFQGRVPGPVIEDQWSLLVTADGTWLSDARRLDCYFELEWD